MTTVPTHEVARKAPLMDRLFLSGCTLAYIALMAAVAYALHLG